MRHVSFITTIVFALSNVLFSSCSKDEYPSAYDETQWFCIYPVQMQNNDTGEQSEHMACISLQFYQSGTKCSVDTGIVGMIASNRTVYEVKWYSESVFSLCESNAGQTIHYYSGTISGNIMSFEILSCDKVERTIELKKLLTDKL